MSGGARARALILTYHAVELGPPPLYVAPAQFEAHLEVLDRLGAVALTVSELVRRLRAGALPDRAVALTFDDGFASVCEHAAPLLRQRGWPATVYCVSGHLGGLNDWPTQPASVRRRPLASVEQLRALASDGWEIGGHTHSHPPLGRLSGPALETEIAGCRRRLEEATGAAVTSFACPYGDPPAGPVRSLIEDTYETCCGTRLGLVDAGADPFGLPRVDAHYLRRTPMLARAVRGDRAHLALRRAGAGVRRRFVQDFD